jgi:uncharacterized protein YbjT (DUF2867 family)
VVVTVCDITICIVLLYANEFSRMKILITGSTGFLGQRLAEALHASGHLVISSGRKPYLRETDATAHRLDLQHQDADFTTDFDPAVWVTRLAGVDVVINTVGILREHGEQTFEALHRRAPQALFLAASLVGVRRVVHISALGADASARSRYHITKKLTDDFLAALPLDWVIVQPSLVYGPGGISAGLFDMMAALPLIPVPERGQQPVQPIYIDDLVEAIQSLVEADQPQHRRVALVGPSAMTLRGFLSKLRRGMGMGKARFIYVPLFLMRTVARTAAVMGSSLLDPETLGMLLRGNTSDPDATCQILGRKPLPVEGFISPRDKAAVRTKARLSWLLPTLRLSVASVWIGTGIVSLGIYPTRESYALLARSGVPATLAPYQRRATRVLGTSLRTYTQKPTVGSRDLDFVRIRG